VGTGPRVHRRGDEVREEQVLGEGRSRRPRRLLRRRVVRAVDGHRQRRRVLAHHGDVARHHAAGGGARQAEDLHLARRQRSGDADRHHETPMLACASPEALIAPIACATTRIRVGSGGVMLPHYSPLKVAETYSMLSGIFPARIDLGVGRAPGSDPLTAFALQRDRRQASPDDFPQQLEELLAYLHDALPPRHQFARLSALPGRPERPDVWLLGSSPQSGSWAAELGLPYAFADFINPHGAEIVERYRRDFRTLTISTTADTEDMEQQTGSNLRAPRVRVGESRPRVIVAGWALCADTDEEAERLGASARMAFAMLLGGQPIPVPPVDEALRFLEEHGTAAESLVRRR